MVRLEGAVEGPVRIGAASQISSPLKHAIGM